MNRFTLLKAGTCVYYHVRRPHGRGYGIHSPFVYRLVRDVLRRDGQAARGGSLSERLAGWYGCTQILPVECLTASDAPDRLDQSDTPDRSSVCYEGGAEALSALLPYLGRCREHDILVLDGIRRGEDTFAQWRRLRQMPSVTATLDLWDKGLVFFDRRLHQQQFIVYAPRKIRQ